jgi:inorganic pyrophosphatase
MLFASDFWKKLDQLVETSPVVIDRPAGTAHPHYPDFLYPYDYGYLKDTRSADGGSIDIWRGSQTELGVTGVLCTVDLRKKDSEIKILIGCSAEEAGQIAQIHNRGQQAGLLVIRHSGG